MQSAWKIVGTWSFSERHLPLGARVLREGGSAVDALVAAGAGVEADPAIDSVGLGGLPNWDGDMELDAGLMDGGTLETGAVASLRGFLHPLAVARDVLRLTRHDLLAGAGAAQFALAHGHEQAELLTETARARWHELRTQQGASPDAPENITVHGEQGMPLGHDTIALLARDMQGHLCAGTTTSGLALKLPGRVGDSPLCGAGFYADDRFGAASATGFGEDMIRTTICFRAVQLMREGIPAPQAAVSAMCAACEDLHAFGRQVGEMAIITMDRQGRHGFAANHDTFSYSYETEDTPSALHPARNCWKG